MGVTNDGGVVAGPDPAQPTTRRTSKALAALVVFLLMGSPMAGVIAAAVSDGWAVPVWLGGWLLAILIPLVLAVSG